MKIVIDNLGHVYPNGHKALDGVDLTLEGGRPVALIGQNGAGKTTLAKHMNGILKPTSGRVLVDGEDVSSAPTSYWSRKVGYIFQNPDDQLFLDSVRKEFEFGPRQIGMSADETRARMDCVARLVGLEDRLDTHPFDLSPTDKKFCTIGSVLMMDTGALVFDEPTCGQDRAGNERLAAIISRLSGEGRLCITISHDMKFVTRNFPRVVLMHRGRVLMDGPREEVFTQADVLRQAYVTPPPITRVAQKAGLDGAVFTVPAFVQALKAARARNQDCRTSEACEDRQEKE